MDQRLPEDLERDFIKKALDRKKISSNYHTALPMFLKSQGPFAVYDHALHRGEEQANKFGNVTEQALGRHHNEVDRLKNVREAERSQFYSNIDKMTRMQDLKT
jgi:hypothetical protein